MTVLWVSNLVVASVVAAPAATVTGTTPPALFAVVIGNNHPLPGSKYAPFAVR